ncbi:MAG: PfkB family carbohydrate kinase [Pirellulaceae bacterium]|jgi:D-beta-D-heptose 7-phosphate kinase/D-beta-D-heptose 1-phosphate adenosyltransferase|nr:PfkB family carbohydrate kinase [Pirellulaceae bacterium]
MKSVTVVGDLILDRYLIGDATKLNPEQPGVVIRVDKEEDRLGGAAAVAMIARGLGAKAILAGVVGRDEAGDTLRRRVEEHDIESHVLIDDRPTTWKQRIVTHGQLRPDRCDREVTTPIGDHVERFLSAVPLGDTLLISDYGKGVCTRSLLRTLGARARDTGVPILVDPARSRDWSDYNQVALIKANWAEATEAAGEYDARPLALARRLADERRCHVVVTLGHHGMVCAERDDATWYLPAEATDVRDVCGAGDTVLAAINVGMLAGNSIHQACRFALRAAGNQVARVGISAVMA